MQLFINKFFFLSQCKVILDLLDQNCKTYKFKTVLGIKIVGIFVEIFVLAFLYDGACDNSCSES